MLQFPNIQEDPSKKGGKVWKLKKPVRSQNVDNLLRFAHLSLSCARRQNSIGIWEVAGKNCDENFEACITTKVMVNYDLKPMLR